MVKIDPDKIKVIGRTELGEEYDKMIEDAEKEISENYERQTRSVHLKMAPSEVLKAKKIAAKKGLKYQTYLKMRLKEILDADSKDLFSI